MVICQLHEKIQFWTIHIWCQIKHNNNVLYYIILYNSSFANMGIFVPPFKIYFLDFFLLLKSLPPRGEQW